MKRVGRKLRMSVRTMKRTRLRQIDWMSSMSSSEMWFETSSTGPDSGMSATPCSRTRMKVRRRKKERILSMLSGISTTIATIPAKITPRQRSPSRNHGDNITSANQSITL